MKKTFKRVVSVLAMLCLFATQFAAFAAEDATTSTEFVNGTEYEYNLYQLGTKYWYVNSNTSTLLSGTGVSKYAIAIYKLPLPKLADDQKITNYKFTIPESHKAGQDIKADFRIVSLEGSTALWDSKLNASLTTKDEIIKKVLYDANAVNAWQAYDVCEGIVSNPPAEDDATKIYTYTIDISKYANDKYMQNDSDHFYVGVWTNWTAVMAWNQNMPDSSRPRAHFTVGEAESLAYTGANVTSGDMFVNKNTKPELYFNRKVSSATATLNGESVDCTVTKGFVKINANLEEGKTHTVAVAATDSTGAQVSAEISFSTYLGEMITQNPYSVSATGAKEWTYVESIATGAYFIYKLPFPKLDPGQKIGKYVFKYYSGRYGATYGRYMKIEQFDEDKIASVTTSHPDIAAVISKNDIPAGYAVQTAASQRATGFVYETIGGTDYATVENEIDLTDYANQCYNECGGEKDYFLVGVNYRWTTRAYPVALSAMTSRGFNTLYYATQVPADNLAIEEGSVADGDERTASSTALNFTYNNAVKAISATLNGEEVPCKIDGNHVTVDKALSQYTDYQLVLNATDIYNTPSLVSTINFKTGAYNEYKALNTDFEFSFIGPDGKVTDTSYHVKRGSSKTAVVKLKIPTVANDESLDRVVYTFYTNGGSGVAVARLDGESWDVSKLKYSDLSPYLSDSGFVSAANDSTYEDLGSSNYRVHRDITNYVKECRDKGQTYAFFALTTSSTIKAYAPTYSGKSYRPYYDYSVSKKEFNAALPKIVAADNSEAYANATALEALDKASSYKTVCSVTNIGNGTKDVVVAIAQYVDETVVNVEFTTVTVPENTSNFDVASKAITLSGKIGKAKAFVWSTEDNTPLASDVVASVN